MLKTVSIHQPSYWPWLGLLDKIAKSGIFILLDDAQVVKGTYQYRNLFYCNGEAKFITLPLNLKLGIRFNELTFKSGHWREDHLNKLHNYYLKAPYFEEVYSELEEFYRQKYASPFDLLRATMMFSFARCGINVKLSLSSQFQVDGKKGDMVLNLCLACGADKYLAGRGSYEYMQEYIPKFKDKEIDIKWHKFTHPVYQQLPGYPFVEGLSCLDIFFFQGFEKSKALFWNNINHYGE